MDGVINVDKPAGISSAGVVSRVKRLLPPGTKIGHAGTLDPFATGVLILLVGKATKASERLMDQPKTYEATVRLGATTATDDSESPEILTADATMPTLEKLRAEVERFVGRVPQVPPRFSAMKVDGRRAYAMARKGQSVELAAREVRIDAIEILRWQWPALDLRIECGRGTYIRALARDLGASLAIGGYLTRLRRTRVGRFAVEQAVGLDRLIREGVAGFIEPVDR